MRTITKNLILISVKMMTEFFVEGGLKIERPSNQIATYVLVIIKHDLMVKLRFILFDSDSLELHDMKITRTTILCG